MTCDFHASHNAVNAASGFWSILTAFDWADTSCLRVGGRHRSRMAERTSWTRLTLTERPRLEVAYPEQLLDIFVKAAVSSTNAIPDRRSNSVTRLFCGLSREWRSFGFKRGEPSGSTQGTVHSQELVRSLLSLVSSLSKGFGLELNATHNNCRISHVPAPRSVPKRCSPHKLVFA
jgi:hypothetical protein